jgi:hypothetical protein
LVKWGVYSVTRNPMYTDSSEPDRLGKFLSNALRCFFPRCLYINRFQMKPRNAPHPLRQDFVAYQSRSAMVINRGFLLCCDKVSSGHNYFAVRNPFKDSGACGPGTYAYGVEPGS